MGLMEGFGGHRERIGALLHHCCECGLELDARAHAYGDDRHTQRRCRSLYLFKLEDIGGVVRIPEKGYAQDGWNGLLENLQPLGTDVRAKDGVAGDISSRSGEAWHKAARSNPARPKLNASLAISRRRRPRARSSVRRSRSRKRPRLTGEPRLPPSLPVL